MQRHTSPSRGFGWLTAAAALFAAGSASAQTEIQWWHAMGGKLGEAVNALAEGFNKSQTEYKVVAGLQGLLHRDADRRDRRLPRQAGAAHRAGVRGRHRQHDGRQGRGLSGLPADGRRQGAVRSQGLYRPGLRLLLDDRRQAAVDAVQLLDAGVLLEQGAVPEGRARSQQAAQDLAGAGRDGQEGGRRRRQVRLHAAMADLDDDREFRRLAQPAVRHQGERLRRHRHRAEIQRSAARQVHPDAGRLDARTRRSSMAAARASRRRCSPPATASCTSPRRLGVGASTRRWETTSSASP